MFQWLSDLWTIYKVVSQPDPPSLRQRMVDGVSDDVNAPIMRFGENDFIDIREVPRGRWRHFGGKIVEVLGIASDPRNPKYNWESIIYKVEGEDQWWIRPKDDFLGVLEYDGRKVYRFDCLEKDLRGPPSPDVGDFSP